MSETAALPVSGRRCRTAFDRRRETAGGSGWKARLRRWLPGLAALLASLPAAAIAPRLGAAEAGVGAGAGVAIRAATAAGIATEAPCRPGEVLLRWREGLKAASPAALQFKRRHGLQDTGRPLFEDRVERLRLPAFVDVGGALAMLRADPAIAWAEPNYLRRPQAAIPNDPLFGALWGLQNTGQANFVAGGPPGIPGGDLDLVHAWDANGDGVADRAGRGRVIVAVIDDAIDTDHPDLAANLTAGFDAADNDADPRPRFDSEVHGTTVAGAVAAVGDNGIGITGAAWNERIMPLRFGYDVASELIAFDYARRNGARIINASYGGPGYSQAEHDAIAALGTAGILLVTSAGNQDSNLDLSGATYPANYRLPNVLAVAATNRQDGIASFSTHGPVTVPLAAPGLQIVTTVPGGGYSTDGINGTSYAAPYVAGIAALILDYLPGADLAEVRARLINASESGLDPAQTADLRTAAGRLNATRALDLPPAPSIVIRPQETSRYSLTFAGGTDDIPVFEPVVVEDGGNARLDPGESATLRVVVENLWRPATNLRFALTASDGILVDGGEQTLGALGTAATASLRFPVQVPASLSGYRQAVFALTITADGGYRALRHFRLDLGRLRDGETVTQRFASGLYDEFHTWVFDVPSLPAGGARLLFETTGSNDIDFFVRRDQPAQYSIDLDAVLDISEGQSDPFFFTNVPAGQVGAASLDGNETVAINVAEPGSYHVTVLNFDRADAATYTLRARLIPLLPGGSDDAEPAATGGGAMSPSLALAMLLTALAGRRCRHRPTASSSRRRALPESAKD